MKVFNLRCPADHVFEGWFASEAEFQQQQQQGWLTCPLCGSTDVVKGLSAPRLARKSNTSPAPQPAATPAGAASASSSASSAEAVPAAELQQLQQAWLQISRHIVANTEDVGTTFAQVARQMHEGEVEERPIRGTATPQERQELAEDGIEVMALPLPDAAKHSLQ